MSNKVFTEKEIKMLSKNKNVKSVSSKGITYTDEFKRIFISEYEKGKIVSLIFQEHGLDIELLGNDRIWSASSRWRDNYRKKRDNWT